FSVLRCWCLRQRRLFTKIPFMFLLNTGVPRLSMRSGTGFCCLLAVTLSLAVPVMAVTLPPLQLVDQAGQPVGDVVARIEQSQTSAAARDQDAAVMDQVDLSFSPKVIAISTGTRVQFPNSDETRHHVYSFSPAKTFELQLFRGNEAPPVEFDKAGLVVIGCNIHDAMVGYIYVSDGQVYGVTEAEGGLTLPTFTAPESAELVLWHPDLQETLSLPLARLDANGDLLRIALPFTQRQTEPEPAAGGLRNRLQRFKTDDN
ncbi:MAG: methylamine utilization protein, partial [Saccharospirillum sp.]